jgi:hypothetical protein
LTKPSRARTTARREAAAVVVAAVDGVDRRPVDGGRDELLGSRSAGQKTAPRAPRPRRARRRRSRGCRRRARERRRAELVRLRAGDRDDAVLERVRRVRRVELEDSSPTPSALASRGAARAASARREPLLGRRRRAGAARSARATAAGLDRSRRASRGALAVVERVERAEAARAVPIGVERGLVSQSGNEDRLRQLARRTSFVSLEHPPGIGTVLGGAVAEASQGRSLSLSRCGARVPRAGGQYTK